MEENIQRIVKALIKKNINNKIGISSMGDIVDDIVDDIAPSNTDSHGECINKTIMFQHEKIDDILNNITMRNLYNYDFKRINKFSVIYQYSTISVILKVVDKLMNKIKNMVYPMLIEYNRLLNNFEVKEDKIIINRFNLDYFYKLILHVLKNSKTLNQLMAQLCKYVKSNFYIDDQKFDKYKNKLIKIHKFVQINLHDLNTKIEDIY
jgi:hypothetical protein